MVTLLFTIFAGILFTSYTVESQFSFTRKLDTINVYPEKVESNTWRNIESLSSQSVNEDAIYQEFSKTNSAYLDNEPIQTEASYVTPRDDQLVPSFPQPSEVVPTESTESVSPVLPIEITIPLENTAPVVEPISEQPVSVSETDKIIAASGLSPASTPESTLKDEVFGFFAKVTGLFALAEESVVDEVMSADTTAALNAVSAEPTLAPSPAVATGEESAPSDDLTTPPLTSSIETADLANGTPLATGHALSFNNFAIPKLESGQFITNVQLRLSLAALIAVPSTSVPVLDVEYSFGDQWLNAGSVILDGEVSNALNGGYFLFALPTLRDARTLGDLKVRVTYRGELHESDTVFIDALWLEVNTETFDRELLRERLLPEAFTGLELPRFHQLLSDTLDFAREDDPSFVLRYESQRNPAIRFLRSLFGRNLADIQSVSFVRKGVGVVNVTPQIDMTSDGLWTIRIPKEVQDDLEPGTYTIEIAIDEGGKIFTDSFDFQWGLLAVNSNKTEYEHGETAHISLAALSPSGNTLCDAHLELYIIDPLNFMTRATVLPSGLCNGNNVIDVPDYSSEFVPTVPGSYEMYIEHIGPNGEVLAHTSDTFNVIESQSLSITRESQTRIYPRAPYTMSLTARAADGYHGELIERVPADFVVLNTDAEITQNGGVQELRWKLDLAAGASQTFSYAYDAPDISPFLYTLGPAEIREVGSTNLSSQIPQDSIAVDSAAVAEMATTTDVSAGAPSVAGGANEVLQLDAFATDQAVLSADAPVPDSSVSLDGNSTDTAIAPTDIGSTSPSVIAEPVVTAPVTVNGFVEHRRWQIASDATGSMIVFWTSGASIPAGWTCISCTATSTFYQRFPLGGPTYGTQGGVSTSTHTASGAVNASAGANSENNAGTAISIVSHSHTVTPVVQTVSALPAYQQLRVIQNNSAGDPGTIPAGAILIFDGTLPAGWARYTPLDDRYPYGQNTIVSGGSNTHAHTVVGTTTQATGSTVNARTGGTQVTAASAAHTHIFSTSTVPVNLEPPFITVTFATSSVATTTPTDATAMWSDTPPAGWLNRSAQTGDPFFERYIKGAITPGTTGGSSNHTHSDVPGVFTGAAIGTANGRTGSTGASGGHTHAVDLTNFSTATNSPPFVTVIFGKFYGYVPIYSQTSYEWFANADSVTPTDPWPLGTVDIPESTPIDASFVPVRNGDIVRLRMQLGVSNSTSTPEDFKLQFGTTTSVCSATPTWIDVGAPTSSAAWIGYDNATPSDGAALSTSTLTGTDVLETYEEQNPTSIIPNTIGIGKKGEWDFVLKQNGAQPATNYCFRMVKSDGTQLFNYTEYPMLLTNAAPNSPSLSKLFDNEKVSSTTPWFEFSANDLELDDLSYQIQVDDNYTFASVNIDKNTVSNGSLFSDLTVPSDKDPYANADLIRFVPTTALTNGVTYYWRVRAQDPNGSGAWGSWSTVYSFTIDTTVTVSSWFQTTKEQFDTNAHSGTQALVTDLVQLVSGSTTGTTTSSRLDFNSGSIGNAWGVLSWNDIETVGTIKYRLQYYDDTTSSWMFIPDVDLPGNSVGFGTSPVNLLTLDVTTYRYIRLLGIFTNVGGTPILSDWTVSWGYRIDTPTTYSPFPNEKVGTTTPSFKFSTADPQSDDLEYEIQWSTSYAFTASTTKNSSTSVGFVNLNNGADTNPFTSGNKIQYTIQLADILTNGTTYWWRIRARDPQGSNQYSFYSTPQSFTVDTTVTVSTWFQTTAEQFDTDILSGAVTQATNAVTVATTSRDTLVAYAEGVITTPRYRVWDGTSWSVQADALDVGAPINWIVTKAAPYVTEYITATLGTDADVNVQVYKNGSWGNLHKITATVANTSMRGFDVAYETLSGDALVVSCDGNPDPSYSVWNGTVWTDAGGIGLTSGNTCGWVKLISDPKSDEIIAVTRDTTGIGYEARVWSGTAWGNSVTWGSMQSTQTNHEGIAAAYEDSGNQAVVTVSNGTATSFTWRAWNGTAWTAPATVALGDDFEAGTLASDKGTDNMALCYIDEDNDIGVVQWNGTTWNAFLEFYTTWIPTDNLYTDRPVDCAYESGGARDGYLTVAYSQNTGVVYQSWNGAAWSAAAAVSTVGVSSRVQMRRTGNNLLQLFTYVSTSDSYPYAYWNGTAWSALQTLGTNGSPSAAPFKESFMADVENPGITATVVGSPGIDFYEGSGPYWQQLSWVDTKTGGSSIVYQVEYYDTTSNSWNLIPDTLIPGNAAGISTGPVDLTGVLPVSTYSLIRPVARLTCNLGVCPTLSDWTVTWAAGITVSGTAQMYDQVTNVTAGTVAVALNGVLQTGKTGAIVGGVWSIPNVNAMPGDVVTVFITGAADPNEAAALARYDGVGNISGMRLYEHHLALGSNDATTTPFTNADIGLYDYTNSEDLFFNATGTALATCVEVGCSDAELYIMASSTYQPSGTLNTPYVENNGTFNLQGNTIYVSRSWDNNATTSAATSTVVFTATSTAETIDETGAISPAFYNLTFGTTTGNATWTLITPLDVNGSLTVTRGTLARANVPMTIAGNMTIGANGFITGISTTTFDGTLAATYTDSNATLQNAGRVVVDGTSKTVQLGSAAKVQSLTIGLDDIFDVSIGNYGLTVLADFINQNTFVARSGTTTFAGTTTSLTITAGASAFYNLAFAGAGGGWSFTGANLVVGNDFVMSTGTVTMPTGTTTITGSFVNNGGTFAHNNGTVVFDSSSARTITLGGTAFTNAFYNVRFAGSGSWTFTEPNATTSNDFRIAQGVVTLPSGTLSVGGHFANTAGSFTHNNGTVRLTSTTAKTIDTNASFNNLTFTGSGSWSFIDADVTALGSVTVQNGSVTFPSGTLTIGGSLLNSATFAHNGGTVLLNSTDVGETVNLGNAALNNLVVNSATGGWTITAPATTTGSTTLTALSTFTLASGQTLSVGGMFTNNVGGASTTWTGSTLSLESGSYSLNMKTTAGDVYGTLRVKANTNIKMWNSSAATYDVAGTGSLYSQDHANVDGDLSIFGAYTLMGGTEYWSYATDFDGTSLATTSRQVHVRFGAGASATFSSSTLSIVGTTTATTTIRNQGSGTYTVSVTAGTTTASYYDFADLGTSGLTLTGATKVTTLSNGRFVPAVNTGTGLTVSSSTIDANPGLQIFGVDFSTTTAITATNVTQTGGTPISYWWFRSSTGTIDGEAFDNDTGDPGSIRWDDSSLSITVSGTIYNTDEVTPLGAPTCGAGTPIRVVVRGGSTYDGSCNGSGAYSIPGVVIVGDPTLTVFLNGAAGGERAVTITKTPTANISNLDLIVGRVITRHEDVSALTIADMSSYDSSKDSDIPFTAATGTVNTLTVFPNTELHVWATSTFTPGGTVTLQSGGSGAAYDGSLHIDNAATFMGTGTSTYAIGGSFTQDAGAAFVPASTTVLMTATTTGKGIVSATGETIAVNELDFTGVGGGWNLTGALSSTANINLATGTLTGTGNITLTGGSFYGNGLLSLGSGTTTLVSTNTLGGTQGWTFGNLVLGTGSVTGTTTPASNATTTILGKLTIGTGHYYDAHGLSLDLRGAGLVFVENGSFLEGTSTVRYGGTQGSQVLSTNYYNLVVNAQGGSPTYTGTGIGILVFNNLSVGNTNTTTFTLDTNDPALDVNGSVIIGTNGTLVGSNSAVFTVGGDWSNTGTFTGSSGTVTFNGGGTHTIAAGSSPFSNVVVNTTGDRTFTQSATTTALFTLTAANNFTMASGASLAVGGTFSNMLGGANTTWTGATLFLYGGGNYHINATTTSDSYDRLAIGANTQIRMWNSSATTYDLAGTASLYSQDHSNVNGSLYVFGAYQKTTGTDFWNYATDFDGTVLTGGSERAVSVRVASGASVLYTGGALSVIGTPTATTTIQNQGSGTYSFRVGGTASTTWSYYNIMHTNSSGLVFSGTPNVVTLSYGTYTVGVASGTALTVGGTVITQNPAKTFTNNNFSTSTGISGFNVTATGTTASSWRFTNHNGSIAGEAYDVDPDGDPGYIVWDNSTAALTFSGHVYSDEGSTVSSVCNGTTNNIHLRMAGLTSYTTSCNASTGLYSISGITYSPGDSFVVYIDNEAAKAATVSEDPVTNIGNLDLYENRVIVRHESADSLSIPDMSLWDSSDDADIPFTANIGAPNTLTLPANRKLFVWTGKEFRPNGNVTLSGGGAGAAYDGTLELTANAIFTAQGTESHAIGGSMIMGSGATFTSANSTVTFTTNGAARTVDTNDQSFYNLTFNGSGSWTTPNAIFTVGNDFTITQGAVTLPTATTTVAGSFLNTGGSFNQNGGAMRFTGAGAKSIRTGGSSFGTTTFAGTGNYTYLDTNATTTGNFTILSGTVTAASGTLAIGGSFVNDATFTHNNGTLRLTSGRTGTPITASSSDLSSLTIDGPGTFIMTDESATLLGSLRIAQGAITLSSTTLAIGGSLLNTGGTFTQASGTVLFNSTDVGETIAPLNSSFHNVQIAAPTGGYTMIASATTTGNFSLTSASAFTLQSGSTLTVNGVFTNLVGGAATTWTGSTLRILTGTSYTVNTKSAGGDTYAALVLGNNTDLLSWNSSATVTLLDTLSSLYSQDNGAVDGELYIYGNYTRTTGADYWSYATDFDGTSLSTTSRAVTVRIANGATTTFSGGALYIIGASGATSTMTNQGSGTYSFNVSGGTLNAQNYAVRNVNASGIVLSGNTTISSIANGDFELAVNNGALLTVSSTTVNYNAAMVVSGMRFATTSAITGVNIAVVGTTPSAWTFTGHRGNLSGEFFDSDGIDDCGSIRWDDSSCLLTQQSAYRWRNDDGGEGVPDSEWFDTNWTKRKRVTITNSDAQTYTNAVVKVTIPYDSDMQADFDDIRFTNAGGTTTLNYVRETYVASTNATFWVKVPSLAASANTVIYAYYGNGAVVTTGVGTSTFAVYDDFEDNNITEYSGNTTLFTTSGSFAYEGAYGLKAVNPNDRTTVGLYRTGVTVAQGQTIRFFDYIDTSGAGSGDEVCTLFGVQTPGTNKNNYGVCLEQFGVDRVSIAKDVYDNDTDTGTTQLASTTITYATGWYEVEVNWKTNNTIAVSVYRNGSLVATTSATDSSYTSGGIGFTYWAQHGGWDIYSARTLLTTQPSILLGFEQVHSGASWRAPLNTKVSGVPVNTVVRPRFMVENTGLEVTDAYRLMYAVKGAAPSCESVSSSSYSAVPVQSSCGSSPLCMQASSYFSNNASTTDVLGGRGTFAQGQIIEDPSNTTQSLVIPGSSYTEVEYAITVTNNATDPNYCLRVTDNGVDIDSYTRVAELELVFNPYITALSLNGGNDINLIPGATTTIYATGTITDQNGYTDILAATTTMFRSGVGGSCTADTNNCYIAGPSQCSYSNCAGNSCDITCASDFYYYAEPTDIGTYAGETWRALLSVVDHNGGVATATAPSIDLLTLRALSVNNAINYGTLEVNADTGSYNATTTFYNFGNDPIDVLMEGTNLSDGVSSDIPVDKQKYATSTFTYSACVYCAQLTTTSTRLELDLTKPISPTPVTDDVFWGIAIPYGISAAPHSGTNIFYATAD